MIPKNSTQKKLFQPDALGKYIVDTFPKFVDLSMSNYVTYAINNFYKPSNAFLLDQYNAIKNKIIENIESSVKVSDISLKAVIKNICQELINYKAVDIKLLKNIFSLYNTFSNIDDNYFYDAQVSDLEDEFICKYKLYLQSIDDHFLTSNRGFNYVLVTIFNHWDHLKNMRETYRMLGIIASYGNFMKLDPDYKLLRVLEIINDVDLYFSNTNKGEYYKSELNEFIPSTNNIINYIYHEICSNYSNTVYLLLTNDQNFSEAPAKLKDLWHDLLFAHAISPEDKKLEEYKRLRNGFKFYFKVFEAQCMAEMRKEQMKDMLY